MPFASVLKQFKKTKKRTKSSTSSSLDNTAGNTSELTTSLDIIGRNSMALPAIMRDINVMKQGILKLVKIAGGTQKDKADRFFLSSSEREKSYESQIAASKSKSPTKVGATDKKDSKGFFGHANDFLNTLISGGLTNMLIKGGLIAGILYGIGKFFSSAEFRKSVFDMIGNFGRTVFGEEGWKDVKQNIALGAGLLLAGIVAVKASLIYLSESIAAAAWGMGSGGFGGGRRTPKGKGGGKLGGLIALASGAFLGYQMTKDSSGPSAPSANNPDGKTGDQGMNGMQGAAVGVAGAYGVGKAKGYVGSKVPTGGNTTSFNEKAGRFVEKTPKGGTGFKSAKDMKLGNILEKLRKYYIDISKVPGLRTKIMKKLVAKFGFPAILRLSTFFASLAAAPFTAGASLVLTLISWGLNAYLIYEIYEFLFGKDGEAAKTEKQEKTEITPEQESKNIIKQLMNQPGINFSDNVTPDYYKMMGVEPPTSTSPSPSGGASGGMTFNQLSREQQDALMAEQRKQEGFRPGTISYDLNNPGNIQYSERAKQFGGVRDTTGRGDAQHKGTFAKFPTLEAGVEAQRDLWSRKYGDVPIEQALKKWAPYAGSNYSENIIAAATSGKSSPVATAPTAAAAQTKVSGSQLTSYSTALENSKRESSQATPSVTNNNYAPNNSGKGSMGGASLPASGVIDNELAKLLVERAIG
ncbi:MAG: hypothetical protein ACOYMA_19500 [Bacteroidia bacterium]